MQLLQHVWLCVALIPFIYFFLKWRKIYNDFVSFICCAFYTAVTATAAKALKKSPRTNITCKTIQAGSKRNKQDQLYYAPQRAHNDKLTLKRRCYNVITLKQCWLNVDMTLCVGWGELLLLLHFIKKNKLSVFHTFCK